MINLLILAGIPGSGKSTWARNFFDLKYRIVSSDKIRLKHFASLKDAHKPGVHAEANQKVFSIFHEEIETSLAQGVDVIADATNLTRRSRQALLDIASRNNASSHLILFSNVYEAVTRNIERNEDKVVPEAQMEKFLTRYYDTVDEITAESYASITKIVSVTE